MFSVIVCLFVVTSEGQPVYNMFRFMRINVYMQKELVHSIGHTPQRLAPYISLHVLKHLSLSITLPFCDRD